MFKVHLVPEEGKQAGNDHLCLDWFWFYSEEMGVPGLE
jgi:hypothetical protein